MKLINVHLASRALANINLANLVRKLVNVDLASLAAFGAARKEAATWWRPSQGPGAWFGQQLAKTANLASQGLEPPYMSMHASACAL